MAEIRELLQYLAEHKDANGILDVADVFEKLERLKILGRDRRNTPIIFETPDTTLWLLCFYAFQFEDVACRREAIRILGNAMLVDDSLRKKFDVTDYPVQAAMLYMNAEYEDEFLYGRLLFLATVERKGVSARIDDVDIAGAICGHLQRHVQEHTINSGATQQSMALTETLKLLFNVSRSSNGVNPDKFLDCVPHLAKLVEECNMTSLTPPLSYLINALLNLPVSHAEIPVQTSVGRSVVKIMDHCMKPENFHYPDEDQRFDDLASPLIALARKLYDEFDFERRESLRSSLLFTDADRSVVLGRGSSLPHRLMQAMASPFLPKLRDSVGGFYFELSDKNPQQMIKNIGFGNASGFLLAHNIPFSRVEEISSDETDPINPVTGQRRSSENEPPLEEMTDEEKEREAERLFVLFERLKKTGVVDVQNPATQFRQE